MFLEENGRTDYLGVPFEDGWMSVVGWKGMNHGEGLVWFGLVWVIFRVFGR